MTGTAFAILAMFHKVGALNEQSVHLMIQGMKYTNFLGESMLGPISKRQKEAKVKIQKCATNLKKFLQTSKPKSLGKSFLVTLCRKRFLREDITDDHSSL